jgi:hypothetical protein
MNEQQHIPGLGAVAGVIRWCESLVMLLSGPLLTVGLAIALIDLLTGGDLLRAVPGLLFAWGVCQAVGIDAQLVATWDHVRQAMRAGRWVAVAGLVVLGCVLGYVGFLSAEAFGFQHAFGVTEAEALARLGIDATTWQLERAALAVFLVALSGFTRYHPPAPDVAASAESERAKLEAALALEPLRQQLRERRVAGARGVAAAALGKETLPTVGNVPAPPQRAEKPEKPPTGPGSPAIAAPVRTDDDEAPGVLRLPAPRTRQRAAAQGRGRGSNPRRVRTESVEAKVRAAWQPGMTIGQLTRAAGISRNSAAKWARVLEAERSSQLAQ